MATVMVVFSMGLWAIAHPPFLPGMRSGIPPVWADASGRSRRFSPREIDDAASEDTEVRFGFLAPRKADQVYQGRLEYLPDNWLDVSRATPRIKPGYKKAVPPSSLPPNVGHNSAPN